MAYATGALVSAERSLQIESIGAVDGKEVGRDSPQEDSEIFGT